MDIVTCAVRRPAGWFLVLAALAAALAATAAPRVAVAHELRSVGPYEFFVGFMVEPAFEGIPNGVDLLITLDGEPVEGAEATLQVEVAHESGAAQRMRLRPIFGQPGRYTADLVPTAPGRYAFHFVGAVGEVRVDEIFEGGPGRFAEVEPAATIQFPETVSAPREMQEALTGATDGARDAANAARAAQREAAAARDDIGGARMLAFAGIALGALGALLGGGALAVAIAGRRRAE